MDNSHAEFPQQHVLMFCGGIDSTGATRITEVIDVTQDNPQWVTTAPMNYPRRDHTLVIGPEGKVYAFNGSDASNCQICQNLAIYRRLNY